MIEFILPGTPPSKNQHKGTHWAQDQKVHDQWAELTKNRIPGDSNVEPPVVLMLLCFESTRHHRDVLNYASQGAHGIQDGLVQAGLLEDDSFKEIQGVYIQWGPASDESHTKVRIIDFGHWVKNFENMVQP